MRLRLLLVVASASVGLVATGCGSSSSVTIVRVSTFPWPEGPVGPSAAVNSVPGIFVPLEEIKDAIPKTLPENPKQECHEGATVVITLKNGRALTYGPCNRPALIERLRLALVRGAERGHPVPTAQRPVAGREWKSLINDWYDGRIDHWYRCAVVREAIKHLPQDPPTFSTIYEDLRSYAEAVCLPAR